MSDKSDERRRFVVRLAKAPAPPTPDLCGNCQQPIEPDDGGIRTPCRNCGSNQRIFNASVQVDAIVTDYVRMIASRDGNQCGYRESVFRGRAAAADVNEDGSVSYSLEGPSPQGEEDRLRTCRTLIEARNRRGEQWGEPRETKDGGDEWVDCEATDTVTGNLLRMQVTRAMPDPSLWRDLQATGRISRHTACDDLVEFIRVAINKKRSTATGVCSVIDARRLPGSSLDRVADEFRTQHGEWALSLGFFAIWLVGPDPSLVSRLDGEPNERECKSRPLGP